MNNPLLEPIHGVSLYDYATATAKIAAGMEVNDICKKLGIDLAVFEEASALWITRMQEDATFQVTTLFGQYFGEADNHPKLGGLIAEVSQEGLWNLEKIRTDRYFFEELNGAREAAYAYGYDGAQWIQDNFGISLTDFQMISMEWMNVQNEEVNNGSGNAIMHFMDYRQQKQKEYAAKFAAEQGGNVADDVEF